MLFCGCQQVQCLNAATGPIPLASNFCLASSLANTPGSLSLRPDWPAEIQGVMFTVTPSKVTELNLSLTLSGLNQCVVISLAHEMLRGDQSYNLQNSD